MWAPAEQLLIHDIVRCGASSERVRLNATTAVRNTFRASRRGGVCCCWGPPLALVANIRIILSVDLWLLRAPTLDIFFFFPQRGRAEKKPSSGPIALNYFPRSSTIPPHITDVLLAPRHHFSLECIFKRQMPCFALRTLARARRFQVQPPWLMATARDCIWGFLSREKAGSGRKSASAYALRNPMDA